MVAPIGALNIFMFIVALLCILVGFFGYLKYGDSTAASITLNLPRGQPLAEAALCLYCLDIFLSYPIQFYVTMDIIGKASTAQIRDHVHITIGWGWWVTLLK